jgi:16S rRNA (guanine527-N7)-methyltransferase
MLLASIMDEQRFEESLSLNGAAYGVELSPETLSGLRSFYSLLTRWNDRLHLVAPCAPEEFATRHVLESLMLLKHLPPGATVADIGAGAGLPIIPCLIARPDLDVTLIESSLKKTVFLREALKALDRRGKIVAKRFEEIEAPPVCFVTSRALDQFANMIETLVKWAPKGSILLLFGGESLKKKLSTDEQTLIPRSEKRYLFQVKNEHGF